MVDRKETTFRCGLTDPSVNEHLFGARVTRTEHGETSSSTHAQTAESPCSSSSGVSSCDSDDDVSSNSGFDDICDSSDNDEDDIRASGGVNKFTTKDGYIMTAFEQTNSSWSNNQPLPLPLWNQYKKAPLVVPTVYAYEDIVAIVENILQHMIEETHYDTVNNFIQFYQSFKKQSRFDKLNEFFRNYTPEINRRNHMCVSVS